MKLLKPKEYGYVLKDGFCLFQKGPLSQWFGAYKDQHSSFTPTGAPFKNEPTFNCSEQWMMVAKAAIMGDEETMYQILAESDPKRQKALGRVVKNFDQALWDKHKEDAVFTGNMWKFSQNAHLKEFLLSFPIDTIFVEAAPWDKVWGIGLGPHSKYATVPEKWKGQNLLGKAISRVRKELDT